MDWSGIFSVFPTMRDRFGESELNLLSFLAVMKCSLAIDSIVSPSLMTYVVLPLFFRLTVIVLLLLRSIDFNG